MTVILYNMHKNAIMPKHGSLQDDGAVCECSLLPHYLKGQSRHASIPNPRHHLVFAAAAAELETRKSRK
jgi:hypothetical protein